MLAGAPSPHCHILHVILIDFCSSAGHVWWHAQCWRRATESRCIKTCTLLIVGRAWCLAAIVCWCRNNGTPCNLLRTGGDRLATDASPPPLCRTPSDASSPSNCRIACRTNWSCCMPGNTNRPASVSELGSGCCRSPSCFCNCGCRIPGTTNRPEGRALERPCGPHNPGRSSWRIGSNCCSGRTASSDDRAREDLIKCLLAERLLSNIAAGLSLEAQWLSNDNFPTTTIAPKSLGHITLPQSSHTRYLTAARNRPAGPHPPCP